MRKLGFGIGEIARRLRVGKTTVSYWCRDIPLSSSQLLKLQQRAEQSSDTARRMWAERRKDDTARKIKLLQLQGKRKVGKLSQRDLFIAGLCLYWGEGYKNSNGELGFTNSDPAMIRFFIRWVREIYGIERHQLILRVSVNSIHEQRQSEIQQYWSGITKIPLSQFTKISLVKSAVQKRYANEKEHFGLLRVKARKATDLRRKILGSIEQLRKNAG